MPRPITQPSRHLAQHFSNAGHLISHLLMLLYPTVVLTLERQFSLGYGELLALSVPGAVLYGICALPAGWLGDRWSAEYMMVIFYVGSGLAAILTGLATGPLGIAIGLTLIGLFGAIYHPVGIAWLVRNAENHGRALGLNGLFGSIGVGSASLVAASLTALAGWRSAFIVPGAACLGLGLALWMSVRLGIVVAATQDRKPQEDPGRHAVIRAFLVLSVTMLCAGLTWQALAVVMPKLFEQRLPNITEGSTVMVGAIVGVVFAISAATQLLGGWIADRFSLKWAYVGSWALQIAVAARPRLRVGGAARHRHDPRFLHRRDLDAGRERAARPIHAGPVAGDGFRRQVRLVDGSRLARPSARGPRARAHGRLFLAVRHLVGAGRDDRRHRRAAAVGPSSRRSAKRCRHAG